MARVPREDRMRMHVAITLNTKVKMAVATMLGCLVCLTVGALELVLRRTRRYVEFFANPEV
jgi:hypothetical protein